MKAQKSQGSKIIQAATRQHLFSEKINLFFNIHYIIRHKKPTCNKNRIFGHFYDIIP
jgi:hypothetical protein